MEQQESKVKPKPIMSRRNREDLQVLVDYANEQFTFCKSYPLAVSRNDGEFKYWDEWIAIFADPPEYNISSTIKMITTACEHYERGRKSVTSVEKPTDGYLTIINDQDLDTLEELIDYFQSEEPDTTVISKLADAFPAIQRIIRQSSLKQTQLYKL